MFVIERGFLGKRMGRISFEDAQAGLADGSLRALLSNVVIRQDAPSNPPSVSVDRIEGFKVHFNGYGGKAPFSYDFGDGTTHTPADGRNTAHTYQNGGDYDVTVTDAANATDEVSVTVPANWRVAPPPSSPPSVTGDIRPEGDITVNIPVLPDSDWVAQYYGAHPQPMAVAFQRVGSPAGTSPGWFDDEIILPATGPQSLQGVLNANAEVGQAELVLSLFNPITNEYEAWHRSPVTIIEAARGTGGDETDCKTETETVKPARKPRS